MWSTFAGLLGDAQDEVVVLGAVEAVAEAADVVDELRRSTDMWQQ